MRPAQAGGTRVSPGAPHGVTRDILDSSEVVTGGWSQASSSWQVPKFQTPSRKQVFSINHCVCVSLSGHCGKV